MGLGELVREIPDMWDLVKTKADLLCMGIRPNAVAAEIFHRQNPCEDWKTGNVGVHIVLEERSCVLVTMSHTFDNRSPYSIERSSGQLTLFKNNKPVMGIEEVPMPIWYSKKTTTNTPMPTVFLHEGQSFLHQAYSGCDYHAIDKPCRFCGAGSVWRIGTPEEVGETVAVAVNENPSYQVCLGGGTRLPFSRNIEYFSNCAMQIRMRNSTVPIWVEMVPPESDEDIARLVESGVTSFGFNVEIWDDILRPEICPGKGEITKAWYLNAMRKATDLLGKNRVGSCLLVGLEPVENSIEGAVALASIGCQPCLLPFKPWDKSIYWSKALCKPEDLIKTSETAVNAMIEYGVVPARNEGCLKCEGCTIDHDIYNMKNRKGGQIV